MRLALVRIKIMNLISFLVLYDLLTTNRTGKQIFCTNSAFPSLLYYYKKNINLGMTKTKTIEYLFFKYFIRMMSRDNLTILQ